MQHPDTAAAGAARENSDDAAPVHAHAAPTTKRSDSGADEEAHESLATEVRNHLIHWPSLSRPLRVVLVLAVVQLLATVALTGVGAGALGQITVTVQGDEPLSISLPVLIAAVILASLSWAYIIGGAIHARTWLRPVGLIAFLASALPETSVLATGSSRGVAAVLVGALVVVVAISVTWDLRASGTRRTHRTHLMPLTLLVVWGVVLGLYADAWWGSARVPIGFPRAVTHQFQLLAVFLLPALLLAGVDYAEWAHLIAERVAHHASTRWRSRPLVVLGIVLPLGFLVWRLPALIAVGLPQRLLMGVVVLAVVAMAAWLLLRLAPRSGGRRVPYWALCVYAVGSYGALLLGVITYPHTYTPPPITTSTLSSHITLGNNEAGGGGVFTATEATYDMKFAQHGGAHPYMVMVPVAWTVFSSTGNGFYSGTAAGDDSAVLVTTTPAAAGLVDTARAAAASAGAGLGPGLRATLSLGTPVPDGAWEQWPVTGSWIAPAAGPVRGYVWAQQLDGEIWTITAWTQASLWPSHHLVLEAVTNTWYPGTVAAQAELPPLALTDPTTASLNRVQPSQVDAAVNRGQLWQQLALTVAAVAALAVLVRRRHTPSRTLAAGVLFVLTVTTVTWWGTLGGFGILAEIGTGTTGLVGQTTDGIEMVVALACLAVMLGRHLHRRWHVLLPLSEQLVTTMLTLLLVVNGVFALLDLEISGKIHAGESAIIVLAFLWDLISSGETITNRNGSWVPRQAAVTLFAGYLTLVATVLMFYSSFQVENTGQPAPPLFAGDFWPQHGMIELGIPVVLAVAALAVARHAHRRSATRQKQAPLL